MPTLVGADGRCRGATVDTGLAACGLLASLPLLARTMGARDSELCGVLVKQACFEETPTRKPVSSPHFSARPAMRALPPPC